MRIRPCLIVTLLLLAALAVSGAQAQPLWGLLLTDPIQCGPPGSTLTYHVVLTNYAQRDLEGIWAVTFNSPHVADAGFDPAFLAAVGGGFLPAVGYTGPLFYLTWAGTAPVGHQFTATTGGWYGPPGAPGEGHSAEYTAGVCSPPIPEPSALLLLGGGLIGLLVLRRRRR